MRFGSQGDMFKANMIFNCATQGGAKAGGSADVTLDRDRANLIREGEWEWYKEVENPVAALQSEISD